MNAAHVVRRLAALAVTAAAAGAVAPAAHAEQIYGGASGNANAFVLAADGRALQAVAVWIDATCDDGKTLTYSGPIQFARRQPASVQEDENVMSSDRVGRDGRFTAAGQGTADYGPNVGAVTETISGRIRGRSARGTFELTVVLTDRATRQPVATCRSGTVNWRGRSSARRVFGGVTTFGHPVVAILDRTGRSVRELNIGWNADCRPAGQYSLSDNLVNFPLSRTGRFGDTFDGEFPIEGDGGARTLSYALRGRVRGTRVTGTIAVTVTDRDPSGTVVATCRRARHRFTATSTGAR